MRPWLALSLLVCSTVEVARAEPREEAVRFRYSAPSECPKLEDFTAAVRARTARGRLAEPEELAGAAVFLASKAGSFTTGQVIVCDGGATI